MEIEREKTYLVKDLPDDIELKNPILVRDFYLPENSEHPKLRLRQKGDKFEITKKTPIDGDVSRQIEQTISLSRDEFESLVGGISRKVEKNRYSTQISGRTAEVDVFLGEHEGLVLCDFEFENDDELLKFEKPDFAFADLTIEDVIAGGVLSGTTKDVLFKTLREKYGYENK